MLARAISQAPISKIQRACSSMRTKQARYSAVPPLFPANLPDTFPDQHQVSTVTGAPVPIYSFWCSGLISHYPAFCSLKTIDWLLKTVPFCGNHSGRLSVAEYCVDFQPMVQTFLSVSGSTYSSRRIWFMNLLAHYKQSF